MNQLLEKIIALQQANDALADAEARLGGIPDWMRELHDEYSVRKAEIDAHSEAAEEAARERREAEAEISDIQTKLQRYQEQINQVTTQREYGALLHEIDAAKARIQELEEAGIDSMERREEALKSLEVKEEEFSDLDERYQAELAKWEAEKPAVAKVAAEKKKEIEALRESIRRGPLSQYDRIAKRHDGAALAPVLPLKTTRRRGPQMWHCGGCNFNVRPQVLVAIQSTESLQLCDSCKKILYLPAEEEEEG